jgi:hypothetical protein
VKKIQLLTLITNANYLKRVLLESNASAVLNKSMLETVSQNDIESLTVKRRKIKSLKPIRIPVHNQSLKRGLVKNSVQLKKEIFSPFREKRKEQKLKERYTGKRTKPTITDFEIGLLDEFIQSRFGLKKKVTAYDMLLSKAAQARDDRNKENSSNSPDKSYFTDRNPYLIDFSKAIKHHAKDIVNHISKNPRFHRVDLNESQIFDSATNTQESLPEMKSKNNSFSSQSKLDIEKCNEIMKSASIRTLNASMDSCLPKINTKKFSSSVKRLSNIKTIIHVDKQPALFPLLEKSNQNKDSSPTKKIPVVSNKLHKSKYLDKNN